MSCHVMSCHHDSCHVIMLGEALAQETVSPGAASQLRPVQVTTEQSLQCDHSAHLRSMTGIGGRPEVVLEGADTVEGPWTEYHFFYKPGNTSWAPRCLSHIVIVMIITIPRFVLPHQPRLDWQMWFAALGSYNHNPWLLSLVYRFSIYHWPQVGVTSPSLQTVGGPGRGVGAPAPRHGVVSPGAPRVYPGPALHLHLH